MTCAEAQELITALIDRELHLKECADCRAALEEQRALKQEIRAAGERLRAPAQMRDRILLDRRIFPEKGRSAPKWFDHVWQGSPLLQPVLFVAILLLLIVPAYFLWNRIDQPIALAALESYDLFTKGELPVQRKESSDEIVAELTRAVGGRFHPMGYDLTAMNLRPVAGLVREIDGRKILVAIYQGQGGTLFCYTFLGSERDAPPMAAKFFDSAKKMNFYAFSRAGINAVLHQEGEVICVLAAEMPMQELLDLVRSKAKPS
jgi:hypothetical protein